MQVWLLSPKFQLCFPSPHLLFYLKPRVLLDSFLFLILHIPFFKKCYWFYIQKPIQICAISFHHQYYHPKLLWRVFITAIKRFWTDVFFSTLFLQNPLLTQLIVIYITWNLYYLIPYIKSSYYGLQNSMKTGLMSDSLPHLSSWIHSPLLFNSSILVPIPSLSSIGFLYISFTASISIWIFIFCSSSLSFHAVCPKCVFLQSRDFVLAECLAHNMSTGMFAEWLNDRPCSIMIQLQILYKIFVEELCR